MPCRQTSGTFQVLQTDQKSGGLVQREAWWRRGLCCVRAPRVASLNQHRAHVSSGSIQTDNGRVGEERKAQDIPSVCRPPVRPPGVSSPMLSRTGRVAGLYSRRSWLKEGRAAAAAPVNTAAYIQLLACWHDGFVIACQLCPPTHLTTQGWKVTKCWVNQPVHGEMLTTAH